jgi:solute carrier family 25 citrate transporter 1
MRDFSVLKTRMQSLSARQQYRNTFHCAYRILTEEGILRFWNGTTPRLARVVVHFLFLHGSGLSNLYFPILQMSGGIVFTVYEKIISVIGGREQDAR